MVARKGFVQSLKAGRDGEGDILSLLRSRGLACEPNEAVARADKAKHDIVLDMDGNPTVEVKRDLMEARTGNLAVEYWNPKSNKPSGLTATTSALWAFVLGNGSIWVCRTSDLKRLHAKGEDGVGWHRVLKKCGDGNSSTTLYKRDELLEHIFFRINDLPAEELKALFEVLVDVSGEAASNTLIEC